MPRTFFGILAHQVVGKTLAITNIASLITVSYQLNSLSSEEESGISMHMRIHILLFSLGSFIGYTLQAHHPKIDQLFNDIYNQGVDILIRPLLPTGFITEDAVDEINLLRDSVDGITRSSENYRLRR